MARAEFMVTGATQRYICCWSAPVNNCWRRPCYRKPQSPTRCVETQLVGRRRLTIAVTCAPNISCASVNLRHATVSLGKRRLHISDATGNSKPDVLLHIGLSTCTITLKLTPPNGETFRFHFTRSLEKVDDVVRAIKREHSSLSNVTFFNDAGARISSSSDLIALACAKRLVIDGVEQTVGVSMEALVSDDEQLDALKSLISQMHASLHVLDHLHDRERVLLGRARDVQSRIDPLEQQKWHLAVKADKRASFVGWLGLGIMGFQLGFLARLTWWDFSWDQVEPFTYFVTYGTAIGMYVYFLLTRQEYVFPQVLDRQSLIAFHKRASQAGFDAQQYNSLRDELQNLQDEMKKIRTMRQSSHFPAAGVSVGDFSAVERESQP